jgi:HNH endonuclease
MTEEARRATVPSAYNGRCWYCTVQESEAGAELELDHFQPRSAGVSDDLSNLVYCCTTCNRLKGDFWPESAPLTTTRRLLHPTRDDLTEHLHEESDGRIVARTETGAFHLERRRLNRPPLLALRQARQEVMYLRQTLADAQSEQIQLQERIATLEGTLQDMLAQIARLLEG